MNHDGDYWAKEKPLFSKDRLLPFKAKDALQMHSHKWCNNTFLIVTKLFLATIFYKSSILSTFKFCDRFIFSESRAFNFMKNQTKAFLRKALSILDNHHKFGSEKTQRKII